MHLVIARIARHRVEDRSVERRRPGGRPSRDCGSRFGFDKISGSEHSKCAFCYMQSTHTIQFTGDIVSSTAMRFRFIDGSRQTFECLHDFDESWPPAQVTGTSDPYRTSARSWEFFRDSTNYDVAQTMTSGLGAHNSLVVHASKFCGLGAHPETLHWVPGM
jgi:hypothetical protein